MSAPIHGLPTARPAFTSARPAAPVVGGGPKPTNKN
jgi:hypothetical protein